MKYAQRQKINTFPSFADIEIKFLYGDNFVYDKLAPLRR